MTEPFAYEEREPDVYRAREVSVARIALFSGSATAGVLVGLGLRHGTALQPFAGAGRTMFSSAAFAMPDPLLAFTGAIVHFTMMMAVAWVAVTLSNRWPQWTQLAVIGVVVVVWIANTWLLPATFRAVTADLSATHKLLFYTVLAVTLWGGIRLAFK